MKLLYAPWRSEYTDSEVRAKSPDATEEECVFCKQTAVRDKDSQKKCQIVLSEDSCSLMMNKYPYNAGHMLAVPKAHKAYLHELNNTQRNKLFSITSKATQAVQEALGAEGTNVGLNLGKVAGAGIPAHLHVHIIPRWSGDTNFLVTSMQTKVLSYNLDTIYQRLLDWFSSCY